MTCFRFVCVCTWKTFGRVQSLMVMFCDIYPCNFKLFTCSRITSTKCRTNTVVSPDDGHIVARDMQRSINILRINCAPSWFYLQHYAYRDAQSTEHKIFQACFPVKYGSMKTKNDWMTYWYTVLIIDNGLLTFIVYKCSVLCDV